MDLLKQLEELMATIDLNEIEVQERIIHELKRFKKFQRALLSTTTQIAVQDIDIRDYARFIMREGEDDEKRELLACLKSKLVVRDKKLLLE